MRRVPLGPFECYIKLWGSGGHVLLGPFKGYIKLWGCGGVQTVQFRIFQRYKGVRSKIISVTRGWDGGSNF